MIWISGQEQPTAFMRILVLSPFSLNMWASILSGSWLTSVLLQKKCCKFSPWLLTCAILWPTTRQVYLVVVKQRPPTLSVSQSVCVWLFSGPLRSSWGSEQRWYRFKMTLNLDCQLIVHLYLWILGTEEKNWIVKQINPLLLWLKTAPITGFLPATFTHDYQTIMLYCLTKTIAILYLH